MESGPLSFKQLIRIADRIDPSGAVAAKMIKVYMLIRHMCRVGGIAAVAMTFRGLDLTDTAALPEGRNSPYEEYALRHSPDHAADFFHSPQWCGIIADTKDYVLDCKTISQCRALYATILSWSSEIVFSYILYYQPRDAATDNRVAASAAAVASAAPHYDVNINRVRRAILDAGPGSRSAIFDNLSRFVTHPAYPHQSLDLLYCLATAMAHDETERDPAEQTFLAAAEEWLGIE